MAGVRNRSYWHIDLNAQSTASGAVWKLLEGVDLLEELCHWGSALRLERHMSLLINSISVLFLQICSTEPCLPASCHDDRGST